MAEASEPEFEQALQREVAHFFAVGGRLAAGMGCAAFVVLTGLYLVTGRAFFLPPTGAAIVGMVYSLFLSEGARRGWLRGRRAWPWMLGLVSLPTGLFLTAWALFPAGAATYLTGPFLNLYSFLLVIVGFVMSFRLSLVAGVLVAVEYMAVFMLAQPFLAGVDAGDELFLYDLSSYEVALNRCMIFVATGIAAGGAGLLARRLVVRVLREREEKAAVSRLFGQYVSDSVKDRILAATSGVTGERVEVTVLFSDLRGFSTFSEGRDPEEVVDRLNEYFHAMVGAITEHGRVVDKFIGDAIMATFGGALPLEDKATASVRAASAMRERLQQLNQGWAERGIPPFDNGIGLHLGEVLMGPIGSEARKDFTVIGDVVNVAARLESETKAKGVSVLITDDLHACITPEWQARFATLGETVVKGRQTPVALYGASL